MLHVAPAFALASILALAAIAGGSSSPEAASAAAAKRAAWTIRDLGALSGKESRAVALNDRGQIAGDSTTRGYGNPRHAFLWQNGKLTDIGTVGRDLGSDMPNLSEAVAVNEQGQVLANGSVNQNTPNSWAFVWHKAQKTVLTTRGATDSGGRVYSYATAIDERGQVVGWRGNDLGYGMGRAFLWHGGRFTTLGTLPGRAYSWARGINERGQVVGESYSLDEAQDGLAVQVRAFRWQNGRMLDLGALPGMTESSAIAINERGQVLGSSCCATGSLVGHAFLRLNGKLVDLGELTPIALNDRGQVIANTEGENGRAVLWQGGKRTDLGTLGGRSSAAAAINERGQIVGKSQTTDGAWHAFLWQNGKMIDLGTLDGRSSRAVAINERGWIVGSSTTRARERAVLWTPRT